MVPRFQMTKQMTFVVYSCTTKLKTELRFNVDQVIICYHGISMLFKFDLGLSFADSVLEIVHWTV